MLQLSKLFKQGSKPDNIAEDYRDGKLISAFGVCPFAKAAVSAMAAERAGGLNLFVAGDFYLAKAAAEQLEQLTDGVVLLPSRDEALVYRDVIAGDGVMLRLKALGLMACGRAKTVVCPAEALTQVFPEREGFCEHIISVEKGKEYDLNALVRLLTEAGYRREPQLTDVGRFSLRGDILDVWSVAEKTPARIEFFGDEVERIRIVDEESHKSEGDLTSYLITPATEFLVSDEEGKKITEQLSAVKTDGLEPDFRAKAQSVLGELISRVSAGDRSINLSYLLPLTDHTDIYGFGGFDGVIYDDVKQIYDNVGLHISEHENRFTTLLARGEAMPFTKGQTLSRERALAFDGRRLAFQAITNANKIFDPTAVYTLKTMETPAYHKDFRMLATDVSNWASRGYTVYLCAGDEAVRNSVSSFFLETHTSFSTAGYGDGGARLIIEKTGKGAVFHEERLVVVGSADLSYKQPKKRIKRSKSDIFSAPEPGDYVVHEVHGVGRFEGVVKLEVGGNRRDYLLVTYLGTDKLYVPVENMDVLSKFVSDGGEPKLNRLGGADFARVKERVKASVKELAIDLVSLYGERLNGKGHAYSDDDGLLKEFEKAFEHTETDDQLTAIEEGIADLKKGKIMDRLLCGDVGYGKTEVALRIAFKVIAEGKQVAFLAPTTILAKQHYETVVKRMDEFGVRAGRLTRFDSKEEQSKTIAELKTGKMDIVVGTHRLLSKDVDFADLGLLILDEEQRFGVADKEKIKELKRGVNVLTLSATPIPRTLHMSLVGIRDISILDTPPVERLPVQTYVTEYAETLVCDACMREINRGGQVFIVYNRVQDIDRFAARIAELLPSCKVTYAHGQMTEDKLEKRVEDFVEGNSDILVSSTIVENGIDIPRANTMIVVDADRLGLSQLYQLRGRVGRSNRLAYVFFTFDGRKMLTDAAYKRLDAITQFTEFGSGFRIAMRDLEIRGAGSVLGAKQHGHMEKVGYDMYCKLLSDAVGEIRGEKTVDKKEVKVQVDYPLFVPDGYVTDREWRLRVYSKIAKISTLNGRDSMLDELADIYGPVPVQVKNLIDVALIKNLAGLINAERVVLSKGRSEVVFGKIMDIENRVNEMATRSYGKLVLAEKPALKFASATYLLKFLLNCAKMER